LTSLAALKREIAIVQKAITPHEDMQHNTEYISSLLRCNEALINYSRAVHTEPPEQNLIEASQQELNDAFTAHTKYNDGVFSLSVKNQEQLAAYKDVIDT